VEVGQVSVPLVEVEAVPDEELVGDDEAHVPDGKVVDEATVRPVEERHRGDRGRLPERQGANEVVESQAGVEDVLDHEDVPATDLDIEVLQQADGRATARRGARVPGELDELELVGDRNGAREIGEEDNAGLERRDEDRFPAGVVSGDLVPKLAYARSELRRRQVNLADALVARLYDASWRPYRWARRSRSRR
jgi:hypothetical protein